MNPRRHPRTLAEAFGPYTSHTLHPMPERRRETSGIEIAAYIVGMIAVLAVINWVAR